MILQLLQACDCGWFKVRLPVQHLFNTCEREEPCARTLLIQIILMYSLINDCMCVAQDDCRANACILFLCSISNSCIVTISSCLSDITIELNNCLEIIVSPKCYIIVEQSFWQFSALNKSVNKSCRWVLAWTFIEVFRNDKVGKILSPFFRCFHAYSFIKSLTHSVFHSCCFTVVQTFSE